MRFISNLSFKRKLLLLILPPIFGTLFFAIINLNNAYQDKNRIEGLEPFVELSIDGSLIIHELQKERGATSGFIGSKGKSFKNTLNKQRQETDSIIHEKINSLSAKSELLKNDFPQIYNNIKTLIVKLENNIKDVRYKADSLSISAPDSAKVYTDINSDILKISASVSNLSTYGDLTTKLRNYYVFMQAKEHAGQERAVLSAVFSQNEFKKGIFQKAVMLDSKQNAYFNTFKDFASNEEIQKFENMINSQSAKTVSDFKSLAYDKYIEGDFNVKGVEWFNVATKRINQMKEIEDILAENIKNTVFDIIKKDEQAILYSSIFIIINLVITLLLSGYIAKILISQATKLSNTINSVSTNKDLTIRADIQSNDELGTSAKNFNNMLDVFKEMLVNIEQSSNQLATASEEISVSVAENSTSLDKQSSETAQAASATEEMTATVNDIASSISVTSESANHAAQLSLEGVQEVENNTNNMEKLNLEISSANSQVIQLRDSSKEINEIVDVIKAIADQTNLLALNAAIEAARAGDAGRGFAVVADEVRTLAQKTQESTQKIEEMVIRFQSEANSVSIAIESSFEHVKCSQEQALSVRQKLDDINEAIVSINDMCNQVATAAEEQVAATNEIAINIRTINDLADVSSDMGQQIAKASEEQANLSVQQNELVSQFKID